MHQGEMRQVVHLHAISHVSDAASSSLELIGQEADLVATLNKALGELVAMGLNASKLGKSEVSADQYAVFAIWPLLLNS